MRLIDDGETDVGTGKDDVQCVGMSAEVYSSYIVRLSCLSQ